MPTKFDFVSPGIQLREIDQSQVTPVPEEDGLLLIGRSRKGPAMKPVKVNSLENFIDVFGNPLDGVKRNDPWRQGNTAAASYAGYAAQAYLASGVGPVKFIRLGGLNNGTETTGKAGWNIPQRSHGGGTTANYSGSIGLFVAPSGSTPIECTGTLAAIFYVNKLGMALTGTSLDGSGMNAPSASYFVKSAAGGDFTAVVDYDTLTDETITFNFDQNSQNFIRNVFNTDPTAYSDTAESYFLGETFESQVRNLTNGTSAAAGVLTAFFAGLNQGTTNPSAEWSDFRSELTAAQSGWFIGIQPAQKKLFRITALDDGEEFQKEYYVCIKDVRPPTATKPDATFTLEIRRYDSAGYVEKYSNLNLNVDSPNYISKRIGDVVQVWQEGTAGASGKISTTGVYPNVSSLIRVTVAAGVSRSDYPFGFTGPVTPAPVIVNGRSATTVDWFVGADGAVLGNNLSELVAGAEADYTSSIECPTHLLSTTNTYLGTRDYPPTKEFGLRYKLLSGRDKTIGDIGIKRAGIDPHLSEADAISGASYIFTLDDIVATDAASASFYYEAGSYAGGTSVSADSGSAHVANVNNVKQFQAPFFGGFDGVSVLLANPFNNTRLNDANGYERHTIEQALEQAEDRDLIRYDLISMPGITNNVLNTTLLNQTQDRGDALAIVDFFGVYQDANDTGGTATRSINYNDNKYNQYFGCR